MDFRKYAFVLALVPVFALRSTPPPTVEPGLGQRTTSGGVVTLFAYDDLRSSFDFRDGDFGARIEDGELLLDRAQLVFHRLVPNQLSYGFFRYERAALLDLGDLVVDPLLKATDKAPKPAINLFHTLFVDGTVFFFRSPGNRSRRLSGFDNFLGGPITNGTQHIEPQVGHTYVLRFKPTVRGSGGEGLVKIQIIDFIPDSRLTFRWARF